MAHTKRKHYHTLTLAGVSVSIAGLLILLTFPVLPVAAVDCEAWAKEIKNRVEELAGDCGFDFVDAIDNANGCPNLCASPTEDNAFYTNFTVHRKPSGVTAATITELDNLSPPAPALSIDGTIFGTNVYGTAAFFCEGSTGSYTDAVVAVGHPTPTPCGTAFTEICRTSIAPIPILPIDRSCPGE